MGKDAKHIMAPPLTAVQYDLIYNMTSLGLASMAASTTFFFLRLSSFHERYKTALCFTGLVTFIAMSTTSASSTPSSRHTLHARSPTAPMEWARSTHTIVTQTSTDTPLLATHSTTHTAMSTGSSPCLSSSSRLCW